MKISHSDEAGDSIFTMSIICAFLFLLILLSIYQLIDQQRFLQVENANSQMLQTHFTETDMDWISQYENQVQTGNCALEKLMDTGGTQPYLLYLNTGKAYSLGNFAQEQSEQDTNSDSDPVSNTSHHCSIDRSQKNSKTILTRVDGYVDVTELKKVYCDACIEKLLTAVYDAPICEVVLVMPSTGTIYNIYDMTGYYAMNQYAVSIVKSATGAFYVFSEYQNFQLEKDFYTEGVKEIAGR